MATPLGQLLRELRTDTDVQARFSSSPAEYLLDHGWGDLGAADLQEALLLLADAAPPTEAVQWVAVGEAVDTDAEGAADALATAFGALGNDDAATEHGAVADPHELDDPAGPADEARRDDDPADLDDPDAGHPELDDPDLDDPDAGHPELDDRDLEAVDGTAPEPGTDPAIGRAVADAVAPTQPETDAVDALDGDALDGDTGDADELDDLTGIFDDAIGVETPHPPSLVDDTIEPSHPATEPEHDWDDPTTS
ncbi:MAG: hypothetical protein QNJ12_22095 [Ilumatobacter sp.]|uniref:hypothetical protein n=1 Tax=Ilumatobacter sp. TaxID=1967498 RepID=UPI002611DC9B|nr:hypothetical protein [Ilumatobacter sp.]MDJ0771494.1 hypothetical protein [Ilumatobacter sp.]